jgi:hypothetical protein
MTKQTNPSGATKQADEAEARSGHEADRMPTDEEARLADSHKMAPGTSEHMSEMAEKGKNQKGEGRI